MEHQTIDWRCPVCCYGHEFVIDRQCNPRFIAVGCPMCRQVSPLASEPALADTPQATNVRVVPETCGLTEAQRATSERLLRLALEG